MAFNAFNIVEISSVIMFFIGFYGVITSRNVIKSIASIALMEIAVVGFFLSIGYHDGIMPPIGQVMENVADPLPQSVVITAIIIGVTVSAVNITMLITLYRQWKTADWDSMKDQNKE